MRFVLDVDDDLGDATTFVASALHQAVGVENYRLYRVVSPDTLALVEFDPVEHDGNPPEASGVQR